MFTSDRGQGDQKIQGISIADNNSSLPGRPSANGITDRIEEALVRNAQVNAENVRVHVSGTRVTLSGEVGSWVEKQQAGRAAWSSPNVTDVDNLLYVQTY